MISSTDKKLIPSADICRPIFTDAFGQRAYDPLILTCNPTISLHDIARSLSNPVLETNVGAPCLWEGVSRVRAPFRFAETSSSIQELPAHFSESIARAIGDAETVVLLLSGGLDSFATLVEVSQQCKSQGRRLLPVVFDWVDDTGTATAPIAARQAAAVTGCPEPIVLTEQDTKDTVPDWSPNGPSRDAHTGMWRQFYDFVSDLPNPVVLTGEGGDEVMAAWNFATRNFIASRKLGQLSRYLFAFGRYGNLVELFGEALSIAEPLMSRPISFRFYLSIAWPKVLNPIPGDVLGAKFHDVAMETHRAWLMNRLAVFRHEKQKWADASYYDEVFPYVYDAHSIAAPIRFRSAFCDSQFIRYCSRLPPAVRFDSRGKYPYHWYKALQLQLIPKHLHSLAPTYKMLYANAIDQEIRRNRPTGKWFLEELGLLRTTEPEQLARAHPFLPVVARNIEYWLRGAVQRGYRIGCDD